MRKRKHPKAVTAFGFSKGAVMGVLQRFLDKIRERTVENSASCDGCGREVFSYPTPRLCEKCLEKITLNDGYFCQKCGRPTRLDGVCKSCKRALPEFEKGASALAYFDFSAGLVNQFKNGKRYLAYYFAEEMHKVIPRLPQCDYMLVAVPLTRKKKRMRGYNQSTELVKRLAALTGFSHRIDLLEKVRDNEQKQLSAIERRRSIVGLFRVTDRKFCKGKDFLVVDDIMTSGATLSEIASRLLRAGASSVCVITVSAVPDRD